MKVFFVWKKLLTIFDLDNKKMKYYDLLQIARESTQEKATHTKQQFSVKFFRELGFYFVQFFYI